MIPAGRSWRTLHTAQRHHPDSCHVWSDWPSRQPPCHSVDSRYCGIAVPHWSSDSGSLSISNQLTRSGLRRGGHIRCLVRTAGWLRCAAVRAFHSPPRNELLVPAEIHIPSPEPAPGNSSQAVSVVFVLTWLPHISPPPCCICILSVLMLCQYCDFTANARICLPHGLC